MRTALPEGRFTTIDRDLFVSAPIQALVSGTAVNMAKAAAPLFDATVIAKIGSDDFTSVIRATASNIDARWRLMQDRDTPNGKIIIVRDAPAPRTPGNRLLISGTPAPSLQMSAADVRTQDQYILHSELFFADCYALLAADSASALSAALDMAGQANALRCLDLVPHDLHEYVDFAFLANYLSRAEVVISSARTLAALLGGNPGTGSFSLHSLAPLITRINALDFPVHYWFLRFGVGDMQETVMLSREVPVIHYQTGYINAVEHAGFGDHVAAWELRKVMDHVSGGQSCLSTSSMSSSSPFMLFRGASPRRDACAGDWGTLLTGRHS
jgi:hypothetical protein